VIPIYRAKKIDSDEYVTGFLNMAFYYGIYEEEDVDEPEKKYFLIRCMDNESSDTDMWSFNGFDEIDISTLAIHFPDMLDSQGNKIFASLSEDGKGGDVCVTQSGVKHLLVFKEFSVAGKNTDFFGRFTITNHNGINKNFVKNTNYKIIGIQE
jgi:hypothetical protein